jgi:hypothetical protein
MTLAVVTAAGRAAATSCLTAAVEQRVLEPAGERQHRRARRRPPWRIDPCYDGTVEARRLQLHRRRDQGCDRRRRRDHQPAACNIEYYLLPGDTSGNVIYTFVPATPLTPSHSYGSSAPAALRQL